MFETLTFRITCLVPNKIDFVFSWPTCILNYQQASLTNVRKLYMKLNFVRVFIIVSLRHFELH